MRPCQFIGGVATHVGDCGVKSVGELHNRHRHRGVVFLERKAMRYCCCFHKEIPCRRRSATDLITPQGSKSANRDELAAEVRCR